MIFVCAIVPVLALYVILLYLVLIGRFFRIRAKLPVLGLKGGLGRVTGKRKRLVGLGILFFVMCLAGQLCAGVWAPDMLMVFKYEEAARGQNPNATRFNESGILSESILEEVARRGGLGIRADRLSSLLTLSTPLDAEKLDITQESDLKISTEYRIHCSAWASLYQVEPKVVLNLLADVYWEDFVQHYAENDSVLDLSFDELEGMEYLDIKDYLEMQAYKLKNYLPVYSRESSSFRAAESGETFASLSQKISNFIEIELERYEAFVLENGLSVNRDTYESRMQYANRLLDTSRLKHMAAHDVRIEAINMYNAFMTRFVLIPTYDTDKEFYMSRTKVGVDYFADEAKEHLEAATELVEEMEHNTYASSQIGRLWPSADVRAQADAHIETLKAELQNLAAQCRELCSAYVKEKRDGYIQICFTPPSIAKEALKALLLTVLFAVAEGGLILLEPFYREYRKSHAKAKKKMPESGKENREEAVQ